MNVESVNPYDPPTDHQIEATRLTFDGVIEERDYAQLLSRRDLDSVLLKFLLWLLILVTVLICVILVVVVVTKGWDPIMLRGIVLGGLTGAGSVFVIWFSRPIVCARRRLSRFPDLLGVARGEVTDSGIVFFDGTHQHWFGPQQLLKTKVTEFGISIQLSEDATHRLPLTARLFDRYGQARALEMQRAWNDAASEATDEFPAGLDQWNLLNRRPDDGIPFFGTITVQTPLRTPELRRRLFIETALSLIGFVCVYFFDRESASWIRYGLLAYLAFAFVVGLWNWWQYFRGMNVQQWSTRLDEPTRTGNSTRTLWHSLLHQRA